MNLTDSLDRVLLCNLDLTIDNGLDGGKPNFKSCGLMGKWFKPFGLIQLKSKNSQMV